MALIQNAETGEVTSEWDFVKNQLALDIARIRLVDPVLAGRMEMGIVIDDESETFCFGGDVDAGELVNAMEQFNQRFQSGDANGRA